VTEGSITSRFKVEGDLTYKTCPKPPVIFAQIEYGPSIVMEFIVGILVKEYVLDASQV
jgi:hypothetical protein